MRPAAAAQKPPRERCTPAPDGPDGGPPAEPLHSGPVIKLQYCFLKVVTQAQHTSLRADRTPVRHAHPPDEDRALGRVPGRFNRHLTNKEMLDEPHFALLLRSSTRRQCPDAAAPARAS